MKKRIFVLLILSVITGNAFSQILVPFVQRYQATQRGGLVMVANSILTCNGGAGCAAGQNENPPGGSSDDNDFNSAYIDVDGDASTFSSSSSDLNLALCSKVTFAGLYWGAAINLGNPLYAQRDRVKIKYPGAASYTQITADTLYDLNNGYDFYTCFKDITTTVKAAGNGTYTIADLLSITGGNNQWAGWGIVVAYRNDLAQEKIITIFDGLGAVYNSTSNVTVNINGFFTPPSGAVNFEIGEIAYDGDRSLTGDSLLFKGGASFVAVSDAIHNANNVFNSTIATDAILNVSRNPAYKNTLGFDASIFKPDNSAKNYIGNAKSSASVKITTGGEQIFLQVITSVIDTYEPDLHVLKTVSDLNGGAVSTGDTLEYTVTISNNGSDTSVATSIKDTLPFNADYVPNSIRITAGPNIGPKTDAPGDDQADLDNGVQFDVLNMRLGTNADTSTGGGIPQTGANSSTSFKFKMRITDDCTKLLCNPTISNRVYISYRGNISGVSQGGLSNPLAFDSLGCPIEGSTVTSVTVPVFCTPPPDSSIGGCLPLVFLSVPGIRPGYTYYNAFWGLVTQANLAGTYYGIRYIKGSSCRDTIRYNVYQPVPTTANAGATQNLCNAASASMAGNTALIGTGTWTLYGGPNTPSFTSVNSPTTTVTGMIPGTYVFRWTISIGCDSTSDTITVINYALPTAPNAGADQNLCNVNNATLNGNSPPSGSGTWTIVSGPNSPTITTPSNPNSTVTGMIAGTYTFRWTIVNGICAATSDDVAITIYSLPTVSNAGADQNLCNVVSANLAGNSPATGTGTWSLISGPNVPTITTPGSANTSVTGIIAGVYVFRWSISNGSCAASTDDVQITVYDLPTSSNAGPDQSLCNVNNSALAGNSPGTGTGAWTLVSGPNVPTITTVSNPGSTVTGMITGVYVFRWTISNGVCATSSDDVQITVFALPTVSNAGPDQNLCNSAVATLAGNAPGVGTGNWTVIGGPNAPVITTPSSSNSTVTGMIPGVYILRWTITNGVCASSTDDVQITNYTLPTVSNAGSDQNLCNVTSASLSGNNPASGSGNWTLVSGPNAPSITAPGSPNTSVTGMITGVYVFRWSITNGVCAASDDDVQITIYALPTVADAGPDQNLCNVTATSFAGNTAIVGTGTWSLISGPNVPTIVTPSSPTSSVTGMIAGVYDFRWSIVNGTCAASTNDVQITIYDLPTPSNAGPDQGLCNLVSATLAANNPAIGTGSWSLVSAPNLPTITAPASQNSTVTGMILGVYVFRWTTSNGVCAVSMDDVQITNYALPTNPAAGPDQFLCNAAATSLAGNIPAIGTGSWSLVSGPNVPAITTPSSPTSGITGMVPGIYVFRWSITNGTCAVVTDDVQITNYDLPTVANAGADQSICNLNNGSFTGNTPVFGSGTWTLISGPNVPSITTPSNPSSAVTGLIPGNYIFRWTITNGVCAVSTDDVQLSVYDLPTPSVAGPDQNLCNVTATTLAGNTPAIGSGNWSQVSGPNAASIATASSPNSTVTGMIFGTYVFRWTISNGSCTPSFSDVQVTIFNQPTVIDAGPDQALCNVTSATMSGNVPGIGTGTWTLISGPNSPVFTDPNDPVTTITGMTIGLYQFGWAITNGVCSTPTDTVVVIIYDLPTLSIAGPNQDLCSVTSTTLAGNTPVVGNGEWTLVSGPGAATFVDSSVSNTMVNGLTTGVYIFRWTISSGPCASSASDVQITIYNLPLLVDAGPDQNLCNMDSAMMSGNVPAIGSGTWTWISGPNVPVITLPNDPLTSMTGMVVGTYQFGWTITNGVCSSPADTMQVINYDLPSASIAGPAQSLCNIDSVLMTGNAPLVGTGTWSMVSGPYAVTITDPSNRFTSITGLVSGTYTFAWTIDNGVCASTNDTVQTIVYSLPTTSDAGIDQSICNDTMLTLSGNVPGTGSGVWSFFSGPNLPVITDPTNPVTTTTGLIPGTYIFRWSITNGVCPSSDDDMLAINFQIPPLVDAGSDQNLCNVPGSLLVGNFPASGSGSWSVISGPNVPTFAAPNSPVTSVNGLIPGTYVFEWGITNGVCPRYGDSITINVNGLAIPANAGTDQALCNSDSTFLNGNSAASGNGIWTLLGGPNIPGIADSSLETTQINGMIPGTYQFVWTISSGVCSPTNDTVQITVFDLPTPANAGADQVLCNAGFATMTGNVPVTGTGNWSLVSGPNSPVIVSSNSATTAIDSMVAGDYYFAWTINNGPCSVTSDTVQIHLDGVITTAIAGPDQQLCNNTFTVATTSLIGNIPGTGSGSWAYISGPNVPLIFSPNSPNTLVTGLVDGTYTFRWTIVNGSCTPSSDDVLITIFTVPASSDAGFDQIICNDSLTTLTGDATATGIGTWSLISGPNVPNILSPNNPISSVTGMVPGIYLFGWTFSNNMCSSPTDSMQVTIYDTPTISNAGNDLQLCHDSAVALSGNFPMVGTGAWSFVSGPSIPVFTDNSNPTTSVSNLTPGVYTLRWTISNGSCDSTVDDMQVTIYDLPSQSIAGSDQVVCGDTSILLAGVQPSSGTGTWIVVNGPSVPTILCNTCPTTLVTGLVTGAYIIRWEISSGVCSTLSDSVLVTRIDLPTAANAGIDQLWCSRDSILLNGNNPSLGVGLWTFVSGPPNAVIESPDSALTSVTDIDPGTYIFRWTISNGVCTGNDDIRVDILPAPQVTVNAHQFEVCLGQSATMIASGAAAYLWTPGAYLDDSTAYNPVALPKHSTLYFVTGTDPNGCSSTDSVQVDVCDTIIIPNAFSPDGDGINDFFVIQGINSWPDNVLHIYNRWGNIVYQKKNYQNEWDGVANVKGIIIGDGRVPGGTYFYVLELGPGELPRTGYLVIRY